MNSRAREAAAVFLILAAAGAALQPVTEAVRAAAGPTVPAGWVGRRDALLGRAVSVAVLGGYRALAADLLWLETYLAWAAGDQSATQRLIRLVTTIDERPESFWLNGARMIAYDMAHWRIAVAERKGERSSTVRRRIQEEQAGAALELLAEAQRWHSRSAAICIEMANLELFVRMDLAAAARWYRTAAELPGAPPCAARIHGELLCRQGRWAEAYAWLRRLHPTLRPGDPEAMADVVLARIRNLEDKLEVPAANRYAPPEIDGRSQWLQKIN